MYPSTWSDTLATQASRRAGLGVALGLLLALCVPQGRIVASHVPLPTAGSVITLSVSNGWDSKNLTTLAQSGKLPELYATDLNYYDVDSGASLSLEFADIPAGSTVHSVKVHLVTFIEPL